MIAIASINHLLVCKGVLAVEEIDTALQANMTGEERSEELSLASIDAINFFACTACLQSMST